LSTVYAFALGFNVELVHAVTIRRVDAVRTKAPPNVAFGTQAVSCWFLGGRVALKIGTERDILHTSRLFLQHLSPAVVEHRCICDVR
jgi:formate-dependent nitrite reductase cytochrome c552 subunit